MGRPIGKRILQACEIVRQLGPSTTRQIGVHMPDVVTENVDKYCSRAVGCGLLTVDRTVRPKQYAVVDKVVDSGVEPEPMPQPKRYEPHALHAIWR